MSKIFIALNKKRRRYFRNGRNWIKNENEMEIISREPMSISLVICFHWRSMWVYGSHCAYN